VAAVAVVCTVFKAAVLDAVPGPYGDRLCAVAQVLPTSTARFGLKQADMESVRSVQGVFTTLSYYSDPTDSTFSLENFDQRGTTVAVAATFFSTIGVRPELGRWPDVADAAQEASLVMLSHAFWTQYLGRDGSVLNRSIRIDGAQRQVIGVMPAGYRLPTEADAWLVGGAADSGRVNGPARAHVIGLLGPNMSPEDAQKRLAGAAVRNPDAPSSPLAFVVSSLRDQEVGPSGRALGFLVALVVMVLLMANANVAMLLVARAIGRQREFAVRRALGASATNVMRQVWLEGTLVTLAGGLAGVALSVPVLSVVKVLTPVTIPRIRDVSMQPNAVAIALILSTLVGVVGSVAPALHASEARGMSPNGGQPPVIRVRRTTWLRGEVALVVVQIATALVLVSASSFLLTGLVRLLDVELGFVPKGVYGVQFDRLTQATTETFEQGVVDATRNIPGLESIAFTASPRLRPSATNVAAERTAGEWIPMRHVRYEIVSGNVFHVLGAHFVQGQSFRSLESPGSSPCAAVVNQSFAAAAWPKQSAVGHEIDRATTREGVPTGNQSLCQVVGVVADLRSQLETAPGPEIYLSADFMHPTEQGFLVRLSGGSTVPLSTVLARAKAVDPTRRAQWIGSIDDLVRLSVVSPRFYSAVFGLFAVLALMLTVAGVYGVTSQLVVRRLREFGIRIALGAKPQEIRDMILWHVAGLIGVGVVVGFAATALSRSAVTAMVATPHQGDGWALLVSACLVPCVGVVAALAPAIRAAKVSPADLLRTT
jgi:predicted permease